jgi:cullin 3
MKNANNKAKFVIKPFRPNQQMNTEQARKIWAALRDAIREIHNKNASSLSFEELYRSE